MTHTVSAPDSTASDTRIKSFIGSAPLLRMALSDIDLTPLGAQLMDRATHDPDDAHALMDLSMLLQLKGNRELALAMQAQALEMQQLYSVPAAADVAGIRLLALMGPGDLMANTPLECLLEGSDVALDLQYVSPQIGFPEFVPDHNVLFVAVGESDDNQPLLEQINLFIEAWPRPVLNLPDRIAHLSRDGACALLKSAPGVAMPISVRVDRGALQQVGNAQRSLDTILENAYFPIIVRPVGSHAGSGLCKLDDAASITRYLKANQGDDFFVAPFVDYRSQDGLFRKYRIMLIEGRPYLAHLAISEYWMIHYLNAGMADSAVKRAEEASCMANFDEDFARRHAQALREIHQRAGLDYLGIDCGETPSGELLIFEIDTSMVVHAMDPVEVFPYKQPQMHKVVDAFRSMLANAAKRNSP